MKRWPAQVITYKYIADIFLELLENCKKTPDFEFQKFHYNLLRYGDIPLNILKKLMVSKHKL